MWRFVFWEYKFKKLLPNQSPHVELHGAVTPNALVESDTKVLKVDGSIQLTFSSAILNGSYYIVVKHRNAIETWSKIPVTFSAITTFDFAH